MTAGEAQYEQELTLEARKLYLIEIDDTPEPTSGRLSVSITVSTDVTEEQVQILFPSGRIDYLETMGAATVSTDQLGSPSSPAGRMPKPNMPEPASRYRPKTRRPPTSGLREATI